MLDRGAGRVAANEILFRLWFPLAERDGGSTMRVECECGRRGCNETLTVAVADYAAVRAAAARRIIASRHQAPAGRLAVSQPDYWIVEPAKLPL